MMRSFVFLSLIFCAFKANSQESAIQSKQKQQIEHPQEKIDEIQREINQINSHLESIKVKRNYILSNEEEKAIAEEEGWFDKMEAVEQRLIEKKQKLEAKLAH